MDQAKLEDQPIFRAFVTFISDPSPARFNAVRDLIVASPLYDPYGDDVSQYETNANAMLDGSAPMATLPPPFNGLLNVKTHILHAMLHKKAGNADGYKMEMMFASRIGDGIMASGNGTRKSPYKVLRTSDEYDVLMLKKETMESQALLEDGDRRLDLLTCASKKEYYFDVTDMLRRLDEVSRGINPPPAPGDAAATGTSGTQPAKPSKPNPSTDFCQNIAQAFRLTLAADDPLFRKPDITTIQLAQRIFALLSERKDAGNAGPPVARFDVALAALRQLPGNRDRAIDSDTPLSTLVPRFRRVRHWIRLSALTGTVLPSPKIPEWILTVLGGVAFMLVTGVMVVVAQHLNSAAPIDPNSSTAWLMRGPGKLLGFGVLFVGMIIAIAILVFLLSPFIFALPKEVETVGDLVSQLHQAGMRDRKVVFERVMVQVRLLVANACKMPYLEIDPAMPIEQMRAEIG